MAATLGISGPALYRHFPSKYALFVEAADQLATRLGRAWPDLRLGIDLADPAAATQHLDAVLAALIDATMRARRSGGIYRWEGRYLTPEDRRAVGRRYEAMGLTTSGLYRHFRGKSDLLMATFETAADELDRAVAAAGIRGVAPEAGLRRLAGAYVAHCFANREQMSVYSSASLSLPSSDQARLRGLQRAHVDLWCALLQAMHPTWDDRETRTRTAAALNVVTDTGRRLRWRPETRASVTRIVLSVVGAEPLL